MKQLKYDKWLEIDIDAVKQNLEGVKSLLDSSVHLLAVLKANAYGHGAVNMARFLYQNGVDFFAVSFLSEALELRKAGIRSSILVFSPVVDEEQVKEAIKNHITLSISSLFDCQLLNQVSERLNQALRVHLKVDSGLGRFGFTNMEEISAACQSLKENNCIYIEGIYTHMADAASAHPAYTEEQFRRFMEIVNKLAQAGYKIPLRHCANSAVFLKYPHMHLDAVRIGTLISGQYPAGDFPRPVELIDPFCFKCKVISLKSLKAGDYLGYSRSYRLKEDAQIAVIPVGYMDGLGLNVANKAEGFIDLLKILLKNIFFYYDLGRFKLQVKIRDRLYPVRGKVFMQMAMIEIPAGLELNIGDEVELPVRKTLAARDLVRIYTKAGEAVKIGDQDGTSYIVEGD